MLAKVDGQKVNNVKINVDNVSGLGCVKLAQKFDGRVDVHTSGGHDYLTIINVEYEEFIYILVIFQSYLRKGCFVIVSECDNGMILSSIRAE